MPFEIFLVMHSHIDVGYTDRQERIADYQADFIRQAVDYALSDKQKNRAEDAKFKFTAEGFWAAERFLEKYGREGERRLIAAVKSGYFELTGCYFHLAELLNYENLNRSVSFACDFVKKHKLKALDTAMAADINGFSIGMSDVLYDAGIRYLSASINTHHGGAPFGRPMVPFYWKTPKGNRLLVWNGLTYHKANLLGIVPGSAPIGDPGIPGMKADGTGVIDVKGPDDYAAKRLFQMVEGFQRNGYPYPFTLIMGSGLYTDNSPPFDGPCELIEEWNRQYGDRIHLRTATLAEFFAYLAKNAGDIREYEGDWNDWWTDGALSTPDELRLHRNAQRVLRTASLLDPGDAVIPKAQKDAAAKQLILYAEHTWGHSHSFHDPCKLIVRQLDARKSAAAVQADILACTALDKASKALGEAEFDARKPFGYLAVNPHGFSADCVAYLPTDFWEEVYFSDNDYQVVDEDGKVYPHQRTTTLRGAFVCVALSLLPKERRRLHIRFAPKGKQTPAPAETPDGAIRGETVFENAYYKAAYSARGFGEIIDKVNGETVYDGGPQPAAPVYQVFKGANRWDAAGFGYSARKKMAGEVLNGELTDFKVKTAGGLFIVLAAEFKTAGARYYRVDYTLYKTLNRIDISVALAKDLVLDPEGMYAVFPFARASDWRLDKAGGFIKAGFGLPQTCCDYFNFDRGVARDGGGVAINSPDTPLVMTGGLKLWEYTTQAGPADKLYFWLTNNKWETNFRTQCAGMLGYRFALSFVKNDADALQMLDKNDIEPLIIRG
ncbi:MAG: hypothetical protein LBL66_01560 [Clostridiales bacterium]|jgi:hypothetical protein|nr:hypothetical protein [Clostridiales bacterium]